VHKKISKDHNVQVNCALFLVVDACRTVHKKSITDPLIEGDSRAEDVALGASNEMAWTVSQHNIYSVAMGKVIQLSPAAGLYNNNASVFWFFFELLCSPLWTAPALPISWSKLSNPNHRQGSCLKTSYGSTRTQKRKMTQRMPSRLTMQALASTLPYNLGCTIHAKVTL